MNWKTFVCCRFVLFFCSFGQASRVSFDNRDQAADVLQFWKTHKASVSSQFSGYLGAFGVSIGLYFQPQWSFSIGYGGSGHFQSYGLRVQRSIMMSSALNPYFAMGVSRWHRTRDGNFDPNRVSPGFLVRDLLSEADRRDSRIDERLVHGAFGFSYVVTEASVLQDFGAFAEVLLLLDPKDFVMAPTVSVGLSYFF